MKDFIIKDDNSIDYQILDLNSFKQHIIDFHSENISVHEENGHYFTVNDEFREMILSLEN